MSAPRTPPSRPNRAEETPMTNTKIAVIGGSGIYDIDGLEGAQWTTV
jgi:purine nucleoside phosphorylase